MAVDVNLLFSIAVLLFVAKVFGEIAERMKVSSLVGEVLAGILLGPLLRIVTPDPMLAQIAGLGIIFSLFIIGLNTKFEDSRENVYSGSIIALIACGLSFLGGFLLGYLIFGEIIVGVFLGIAILSTSTMMTFRSLMDIGEVKTKASRFLLIVDMADEVIAVLALALITSYIAYGSVQIWNVVALFFVVLGFFLVILTFGTMAVNRLLSFFQSMKDEQMLVSIPLFIMFIVAFLSEQASVAAVTGAFLAGMAMNRSHLTESIILPKTKIIGNGFFIPLFFAYSAVLIDLSVLASSLWIVVLLLAVGIAAKIIGAGFFSRFFGYSRSEQLIIGIGMIPRGEYSIIIAQLALTAAFFDERLHSIFAQLYGPIIVFVLLSIIVTPLFFRLVKKK